MVTYDDLTAAQRDLFDKVHEDAVWGVASIGDLISRADAPAVDKAAVAEAFEPGAGVYFR